MRSTIAIVVGIALSSAALAQVGTEPIENKIPGNEVPAGTQPPLEPARSTDDAAPADRADAPATVTPTPGDPRDATTPPPKAPR